MRHIALAALACSTVAIAMPSGQPWEAYVCDAGKVLDLKPVSYSLTISLRLNGDDENTLTVAAQSVRVMDALRADGFFLSAGETTSNIVDGNYYAEGDTLLVVENPAVTLLGTSVAGAPYENCRPAPPPEPG